MQKEFPGLDPDIREGYISDRYTEILEELAWERLTKIGMIQTIAPYQLGTVTVVMGSQSVALSGGTWDGTMTGRFFRVAGDSAYYKFTYTSPTAGMIDRPYEMANATGASYTIFQNVYPVAADCRILADDAFSTMMAGNLTRLSTQEFNNFDPSRAWVGTPQSWATFMDDSSLPPPRMQVQFWPAPDTVVGIPYEYTAELLPPGGTSVAFVPWMSPDSAMVAGVQGKIKAYLKDYTGAEFAKEEAKDALSTMRANEARRSEHTQLQLATMYTRHRLRRW
jgi:hypothetical protein